MNLQCFGDIFNEIGSVISQILLDIICNDHFIFQRLTVHHGTIMLA